MEKTVKLEVTLVVSTSTPNEPLAAQYLDATEQWFFRQLNGERVRGAHIDVSVLQANAPEVVRGFTVDK